MVFLVVGCGRTDVPPAATIPAATPRQTNLTYVVQRGRVTRELEFNGRVSPVEEKLLYFETSGYVKRILVKQGDQVKAGDLLAELETGDLLNQIAQAELAFNSAQLLLSEAEKSVDRQIVLAELNLAVAQTRLTQAEDTNAYAIIQAELSLALAQEQLNRLTQAEDTNAYAIAQAELSLVLVREELTRTKSLKATYTAGIVRARVGLEQAKDQMVQAEAEYKEALGRPWEPQDVRDGYARAFRKAEQNLEVAQAQYDQAIATMEVYQSDLKTQEIVVKQAEEELEQLKKGVDSRMAIYQSDLKIREIAVKQAEAKLEQLRKGVDPLLALEVQRAQLELERQKEGVDPVRVNDVNQAQLALERLQGYLANAQIVAPVGGEIISLSLYPGRLVEAFRVGIVLADPSAIEVRADISEEQLTYLTEGQKAALVLSTDPGHAWAGTVHCLPYPYGTCANTHSPTESDGSVRISLENNTGDFGIGALVQVTIVLEEKDNVLWLPRIAIRSFQDSTFVIMQDGDSQRRIDVELGIEGQDRVEILKGLKESQVVVAP